MFKLRPTSIVLTTRLHSMLKDQKDDVVHYCSRGPSHGAGKRTWAKDEDEATARP